MDPETEKEREKKKKKYCFKFAKVKPISNSINAIHQWIQHKDSVLIKKTFLFIWNLKNLSYNGFQ